MQKLILAPMATLSHEALRLTIERNAPNCCDEFYTEMIQATSCMAGGQYESFYLRTAPDINRLVWQLTCGKAEPLADCAKMLSDLGGIGVDINMGCCAPEIFKQGAGIAWMLKPVEETAKMLLNVKKNIGNMRLSAKIRLGDENYTQESLFNFCKMLVEQGVSQIVLHPRTRKAKFKRNPDYKQAQCLKQFLIENYGENVKLIVNGDIKDKSSLKFVQKLVPNADGFMIGRAAVQKPWVFEELKDALNGKETPKKERDLQKIALAFLEDLKLSQPQDFWISRAMRFFAYYSNNFMFSHYLQTQVFNTKTLDELKTAFLQYFEKQANEKIKIL